MKCSNKYEKFIEDFFPKSFVKESKFKDLIYNRVCENNVISDIYIKYIREQNISCQNVFLIKYKEQFNKILLYVAVNEESSIEFCVRATIEYLLKFIYSLYFNKKLEIINRTSFRNLKDDIKTIDFHGKEDIYDSINKLFGFYGRYSNSIHGKGNTHNSGIEYIEDIIQSDHYDLNSLDKTLINILDEYQIIMNSILNIKDNPLSSSELIRIKNTVNSKRYESIIDRIG